MTLVGFWWITDKTAKAIARMIQLAERQTDDRALEIYEALRRESDEYYTFLVITTRLLVFPFGGGILVGATPERLARIFLEDAGDKNKFVRAAKIEWAPFDPREVVGRKAAFAQATFIIQFPKRRDDGSPLITQLNQKVRLRLPTDAGEFTVDFNVSDFKVEQPDEL